MESSKPEATTYVGLPVCSLHVGQPWGSCECSKRARRGWAMLTPKGRIIVNSVRDTAQATRLAAGEGRAYRVLITQLPEEVHGR